MTQKTKEVEAETKPKCPRCGAEHTVANINHWQKDWWHCQVCNIRWEEDEYE